MPLQENFSKILCTEGELLRIEELKFKTDEYLELLIGILGKFYNDEQGLRDIWSNPSHRKDLLNKLKEMNIDESQLEDLKDNLDASRLKDVSEKTLLKQKQYIFAFDKITKHLNGNQNAV